MAPVSNEFAKMRSLRIMPLFGVLSVLVFAIACFAVLSEPDLIPGSAKAWNLLLMGVCQGTLMASPLLLAVVASRQVDIEHQGNGWLLGMTSGTSRGRLGRAKFTALAVPTVVATVLGSAGALAFGTVLGSGAPAPYGRWLAVTAAVSLINLVVLALHIALSARIENQLVGIGVGLLGVVFAMMSAALPAWVIHMLPWGYYTLAQPAGFRGPDLVQLDPPYAVIVTFCGAALAAFAVVTDLFDRQEL